MLHFRLRFVRYRSTYATSNTFVVTSGGGGGAEGGGRGG